MPVIVLSNFYLSDYNYINFLKNKEKEECY